MTEGANANAPAEMSEGVKILYKGAIDNIIFLKRQQWIITNYALIVYAAVFALSRGTNGVEKTLLTLVAGSGWAYATYCMGHTQYTLHKLRRSLFLIYQAYFTEKEREAFKLWPAQPGYFYTPAFICGLVFANAVAAAATIYLIWRTPPLDIIAPKPVSPSALWDAFSAIV